MYIPANSPEDYISKIPEERQEAFRKIMDLISKNLPPGFKQASAMECPGGAFPWKHILRVTTARQDHRYRL